MLPVCRTEGEGFSIPTFDVVPSDVEGFMDERVIVKSCVWRAHAASCSRRKPSLKTIPCMTSGR
jgi:hypothetical protein